MSSHTHSSHQNHSHQHDFLVDKIGHTRFILGIAVNIIFICIELFYGWVANAGLLIAEAFHHFGDILSIIFSWIATVLAQTNYREGYTYGYRRANILLGVLNVGLLFIVGGRLIYEGVESLFENKQVDGQKVIYLAMAGVGVNYFTAWLFAKGRKNDLNIQNTYYHFMLDAMVTLGVVVAGGVIWWTKWYWLDGLVTCLVALIIMYNARNVFSGAFLLLLDAAPPSLNVKEISDFLSHYPQVKDVQNLRIWGISTTENALTAHVFTAENTPSDFVLKLQNDIKANFNISHITIQVAVFQVNTTCNHSHETHSHHH
jgi:cobalt-zinc-cadmium efflux system protein